MLTTISSRLFAVIGPLLLLLVAPTPATAGGDGEYGTVIGIDLGTTYSCASVFRAGKAEIIPNQQGHRTTPSYVAFTTDSHRLVGAAAKNQASSNPASTIFDIK